MSVGVWVYKFEFCFVLVCQSVFVFCVLSVCVSNQLVCLFSLCTESGNINNKRIKRPRRENVFTISPFTEEKASVLEFAFQSVFNFIYSFLENFIEMIPVDLLWETLYFLLEQKLLGIQLVHSGQYYSIVYSYLICLLLILFFELGEELWLRETSFEIVE